MDKKLFLFTWPVDYKALSWPELEKVKYSIILNKSEVPDEKEMLL